MTCALCGNPFPCVHNRRNIAVLLEETENHSADLAAEPLASHPHEDNRQQHWRREVISRVQQHRARRRKRSDPDALELDFPAPEPLDGYHGPAWGEPDGSDAMKEESLFIQPEDTLLSAQEVLLRPDPPKIIHFPVSPFTRLRTAEPLAADEAAAPLEPSLEVPRILDAGLDLARDEIHYVAPVGHPAEQLQLLPSFDDIHLEASEHQIVAEPELAPQPAPLGQRMIATAIDLAIVLVAALVFKVIFAQLAEDNPQSRMALLCAMAVGGALWMLYQYLFLVHGERTPGMFLTALELATLEGKAVGRKGRRLRALSSGLSGFSLGLGYGWALVDEDQLGWHDRMTGTLMKSSRVEDPSDEAYF